MQESIQIYIIVHIFAYNSVGPGKKHSKCEYSQNSSAVSTAQA